MHYSPACIKRVPSPSDWDEVLLIWSSTDQPWGIMALYKLRVCAPHSRHLQYSLIRASSARAVSYSLSCFRFTFSGHGRTLWKVLKQGELCPCKEGTWKPEYQHTNDTLCSLVAIIMSIFKWSSAYYDWNCSICCVVSLMSGAFISVYTCQGYRDNIQTINSGC